MQHKGEIIEKAVRQSGYPITKLAKKLGKSRRWIYHIFENSNVSLNVILEIGEIIYHDFSDEIKELKKYKIYADKEGVKNFESIYKEKNEEVEYWKNKYLELLEKHNLLLSELTKNPAGGLKKQKRKG